MGLVPVARSPELKRHRKTALDVLNQLQPIVAARIDRYVQGDRKDKSRCPGLNFYQALKTYAVVANQWKAKNVDGDYEAIKQRQGALEAWVNRTAERTEQFIQAELGDMADNLLGQIEAGGDVLDALDLRLLKNLDKVISQQPPTRIDLAAKRREMAGPHRPVDAKVGATTHILVDTRGKELKLDEERDEHGERPYSFYAHLTGQPQVEVKLPDKASAFLLARTFKYRGEQWRFDIAAGPRMTKGKKRRPEDILNRTAKGYGVLPAVRYADSAPGSDFVMLLKKFAPLREDHGRLQRMLLEMVSSRHVTIGTTRIGWFKDVPGPQHPFGSASRAIGGGAWPTTGTTFGFGFAFALGRRLLMLMAIPLREVRARSSSAAPPGFVGSHPETMTGLAKRLH